MHKALFLSSILLSASLAFSQGFGLAYSPATGPLCSFQLHAGQLTTSLNGFFMHDPRGTAPDLYPVDNPATLELYDAAFSQDPYVQPVHYTQQYALGFSVTGRFQQFQPASFMRIFLTGTLGLSHQGSVAYVHPPLWEQFGGIWTAREDTSKREELEIRLNFSCYGGAGVELFLLDHFSILAGGLLAVHVQAGSEWAQGFLPDWYLAFAYRP